MNSISRTAVHYLQLAASVLRTDGPTELMYRTLRKYKYTVHADSTPARYVTWAPLFLLYQLHLMLDERAIAYSRGRRKWQVLHLPRLQHGRQLPTLDPTGRYRHGSTDHQRMMKQLYTYPGFVRVEPGDVVVDVGAYIGSFSTNTAEHAAAVIAIEPNAANDSILQYNTANFENIEVVPQAAWNTTEQIEINESRLPSENSILEVDSKKLDSSYTVQADTVPNIVHRLGHQTIDFLKIEAEGVEPEILTAALENGMEIHQIAVDASGERGEEDCKAEIIGILQSHGYRSKTKEEERWWGEDIVFARPA